MGRQRKLKKQRKGFGKLTKSTQKGTDLSLKGIPKDVLKDYNVFTLGEVAWQCYQKHGKGVCAYAERMPFQYLRNQDSLKSSDLAFLETYDPQTQIVLTYPLVDKDALWQTEIINYSDEKAKARILVSKEVSLDYYLFHYVID